MKLLLDTQILLWALSDDRRLGAARRTALLDPATELTVSAASIWEIGIKKALGKLEVPDDLEAHLDRTGCRQLPISWRHAREAATLPRHHADPFDRMLIAQANCEALVLMTADKVIRRYTVSLFAD